MQENHPDYAALSVIRDAIADRAGGLEKLRVRLPEILQDAVDFVIDPVRTARTRISELDNVEKTFIGLKIEHYFRDEIDVPKGLRDLNIDGIDVDIKSTVGKTWMIPPETFRNQEPCLLFAIASEAHTCSLGLLIAKPEYLGSGANRDQKKSVSKLGKENILWLVADAPLPESRWTIIEMSRFREIRKSLRAGTLRAAAFFRENLRKPIHRSVLLALLHDQEDPMKRLRGNGGARDVLRKEGIALVSGAYGKSIVDKLGFAPLYGDEHMAINALNDEEAALLRQHDLID